MQNTKKLLITVSAIFALITSAADVPAQTKPDGRAIIYRRTNPETANTYIGKSLNEKTFERRKADHRKTGGVAYEFEIIARPKQAAISIIEQDQIEREGVRLEREGKGRVLENRINAMAEHRFEAHIRDHATTRRPRRREGRVRVEGRARRGGY